METIYSDNGSLIRLRYRLTSTMEVCLSKWSDTAIVPINCRKDCFFENGNFDKSKSKSISIRWDTHCMETLYGKFLRCIQDGGHV